VIEMKPIRIPKPIKIRLKDSESWDHGITLHPDGRITDNGGQVDHDQIFPDDYDDPEIVRSFLENPESVFD